LYREQFANSLLDFDEAASTEVTQEIEIIQSRDFVEYGLRPAKFPATQSVTLFFPSNYGEDTTRLYSIGFKGDYKPLTVGFSILSSLIFKTDKSILGTERSNNNSL
jgi:hypothetical protein